MSLTPLAQNARRKAVWGPKRALAALILIALGFVATPLAAAVAENEKSQASPYRAERQDLARRENEIRAAIAELKSQLSSRGLSEEIAGAAQRRSAVSDAPLLLSELESRIAAVRRDASSLDGFRFWLSYEKIQGTVDRLSAELPKLQAGVRRAAALDQTISDLEARQANDAALRAEIETLTAQLGDVKQALASLPVGVRGEGGPTSEAIGTDGRPVTRALPGRPNSSVRGYKLDPEVARRRTLRPQGASSVIVTLVPGAQLPKEFSRFARTNGKLQGINGQVLDIPNRVIGQLESRPEVFQIHENRPIKADNYRTSLAVGARAVQRGYGLTGAGIGVAVIDSGIATWHDDLTNRSSVSYPYGDQRVAAFVDFVNGLPLPYDDQGHGTHVAGIIGANGHDSGGRQAGVAPEASLVSLKVLDANGAGTIANAIAALDWVVAHHAEYNIRVVNLSVGAAVQESYWTDPLTLAAKRVVDAGITVVTAAGNRGKNADGVVQYGGITAPGNAPWVLTVGASSSNGTTTRDDDSMAAFSSRGPTFLDWAAKPDVVAPGYGTISLADPLGLFYTSKAPFLVSGSLPTAYQPYLSLSGTSMAAPVVSGTVALMLQANPSLTPNAVKAILQYTSQENPNESPLAQGAGFLNTVGAVRLASFYAGAQPGAAVPTQAMWSKNIIWGNHKLGGGLPVPFANAYAVGTNWGAAQTDDGDNIVWGTLCDDCDNIVWGTFEDGDNIVWGTSGDDDNIVWGTATDDDNIVWGTDCGGADCDNIVWGTEGDDNIVWGTADDGDNIVWGTLADDNDNIVWGTDDADNIVWGTLADDNIVWGTDDADNIVWGTVGDDNIVWGTDGDDNIVWGTVVNGEVAWVGGAGSVTTLTWNDVVARLTDEEIFELLESMSSAQAVDPVDDQPPVDPVPSDPALSDPAAPAPWDPTTLWTQPMPGLFPTDPAPSAPPAELTPSDPALAPSEPAPSSDWAPAPADAVPASPIDPAPSDLTPALPADPSISGGGL
jgi:serine protease AprX